MANPFTSARLSLSQVDYTGIEFEVLAPIYFQSGDPAIAQVDDAGQVFARTVGRTSITVLYDTVAREIPVTVRQIPARIEIASQGALQERADGGKPPVGRQPRHRAERRSERQVDVQADRDFVAGGLEPGRIFRPPGQGDDRTQGGDAARHRQLQDALRNAGRQAVVVGAEDDGAGRQAEQGCCLRSGAEGAVRRVTGARPRRGTAARRDRRARR